MKLISKNVDVFVAILACVVAMLGCTRQDNAARRLDEGLSQVTTEKVKATPPHDATKPSETPGRMVAPPEHTGPWSIKVSPEPLVPGRSANTGDYRGRWPDYRPPKAILMTAPELPPGIEGPTVDLSVTPSQAGR
ncbi:MAG: hypothetical protein WBH86_00110 [Thermogutta sp.]|nr:hypothetical protein [Thermogutta sp.]HPU05706.1 hypothetical protein [Thermogutta sp.]HQF12387.1 hypothetical protein [Thermogutta sp.]